MIFTDETAILPFYPVTASFKFDNLKPIIEFQSEPKLRDIIGAGLFNLINDTYLVDESALTAKQTQLLRLCRSFIANHALFLNVSPGSIAITEGGIQVSQNTNWVPASQYKIEELKRFFINASYASEELLLEFLEENSVLFPLWTASEQYTQFKEAFIQTGKEFSRYHDIHNSRRTFRGLKTIMLRVQDEIILPVICKDLFDEIIQQIKDGAVSVANAAILPFIRMAVAKQTIADSLFELGIQILPGEGAMEIETAESEKNIVSRKQAPTDKKIILHRKCTEIASHNTDRLMQFLYANIDNYPLFSASTCYVAPTGNSDDINTDEDSNVFLM